MAFPALPAAADMITSTTAYMGDLFTAILPWALAGLGLVLAGLLIRFLVGKMGAGIRGAFKSGGSRGRRGRRR